MKKFKTLFDTIKHDMADISMFKSDQTLAFCQFHQLLSDCIKKGFDFSRFLLL